MNVSDVPAHLTMDKMLLERAVMNVLNNALEHSPQGGTIYVSVGKANGCVQLSVIDEGAVFHKRICIMQKSNFIWLTRAAMKKCTLVWGFPLPIPLWSSMEVSLLWRMPRKQAALKLQYKSLTDYVETIIVCSVLVLLRIIWIIGIVMRKKFRFAL